MQDLPGYGDQATWPAINSTSDPRYQGYTGYVTKTIGIGNGGWPVTCTASVVDGEVDYETMEVIWNGQDISGLLIDEAWNEIYNTFDEAQ